MIIFLM